MTYATLTDRFMDGDIDSTSLFDGLRALGFTLSAAEEHVSLMRDVRVDRALAVEIDGWADELAEGASA